MQGLIPEPYAPFAQRIFAAFAKPAAVTKESDVAEGVWQAANDSTGRMHFFPRGPTRVALTRAVYEPRLRRSPRDVCRQTQCPPSPSTDAGCASPAALESRSTFHAPPPPSREDGLTSIVITRSRPSAFSHCMLHTELCPLAQDPGVGTQYSAVRPGPPEPTLHCSAAR